MKLPEVFILLFILCCVSITAVKQYTCSWYGECGESNKGKKRTCVSNTAPQLIENATVEANLRTSCPHLFENNGSYLKKKSDNNLLKYNLQKYDILQRIDSVSFTKR